MAPVESVSPPTISAEVVFSPAPRVVDQAMVNLPAGACLRDALQASGLIGQSAGLSWQAIEEGTLALGIWGRRATLDQRLRDRDRVEVYRFLKVDPKEARRQRYRAHGEKLPKGIHRPKPRSEPSGSGQT